VTFKKCVAFLNTEDESTPSGVVDSLGPEIYSFVSKIKMKEL